MAETNKYLLLARQAKMEDNDEDAVKYYDMVRTDDPENAEAKFFYAYYRLMSGTQGEAYEMYTNLCKSVTTAKFLVFKSEEPIDEKLGLLKEFADFMREAKEIAINSCIRIGRSSEYYGPIVNMYSMTLKELGKDIKANLQDDENVSKTAAYVWDNMLPELREDASSALMFAYVDDLENIIEELEAVDAEYTDKLKKIVAEVSEEMTKKREEEDRNTKPKSKVSSAVNSASEGCIDGFLKILGIK
jgi:hypothetical protein